MSTITSIDFPSPTPIIRQHLNNATFYYKTLHESRYSSLINVEWFNHFNALLNANLDGLYHAGQLGLHEALSALKRWKGYEDAFIYALLFNELDNEKGVDNFWRMIKTLGFDAFIGAIDALVRMEITSRNAQLAILKDIDLFVFYIALLKIKAYDDEVIQYETFLQYLSSPSKEVKIALCDYTKNMGLNSVSEDLWQLFNHETDLTIKYAAIEAISWLSDDYNCIYSALIQLIQLYLDENGLKGSKNLIHSETMENIARLMGYMSFTHDELISSEQIQFLPNYLKIIYYANSGNTGYLPNLISYLDDPELSRLAFKGICLITGIDVNSPELTFTSAEQVELAVDSRVRFLSSSVNQVNPAAVEKNVLSLNLQGRVLLGKHITIPHCEKIIQNGYQLARHIANWHLSRLGDNNKYSDICYFDRINIRSKSD
ncbi:hypothetical protein [Providencia rettgeri]|uniref:hypothetical protein n=1 Tax=Providencia rettgeri TaxID=587 RepID=UPI0029DC6F09|nr:hypothetical protein [Providencia rettgeri]MDX7324590.1 hypothetical protein [Providencia rettgeri]